MNEFSPKAAVPPPTQPYPPHETSQHWLKRPLAFGLSIPWIGLYGVIIIAAAWWLFVPPSAPSVNRLAFGEQQELQPAPFTNNQSFAPATPDVNVAQIQDQVAAMVTGVRGYSEANREAIETLAVTVKALVDGQKALTQQVGELQAQVALASASRPPAKVKSNLQASATKQFKNDGKNTSAVSPLAGMRRVAVQNGMAWVSYQDKTWAVQVGDPIGQGPVIVTGIDAKSQQVHTSAGILE